ncbi:MAG: 50S ribosomal protein L25 [bacterium]
MEEVNVEAQERKELTKGQIKESRRKGLIPAVIYGHGENSSVFVNEKAFREAIHTHAGLNAIINMKLGNGSYKVIVKDIQRNPITDNPIHVDFQSISLKEKIEVNVPLRIIGEALGVKEKGGVVEHIVREVEIKCLPTNIPEEFVVDVSELDIGQGIHMKDIQIPDNVESLMDPEIVVVHVVSSTKIEEVAVAETATELSAEPEVISKGKKEEEGEVGKEQKKAPQKEKEKQ